MELVQRSIYGGVLILIIIAVRILLLDKLPKRAFPILWGIALFRLLVPFSIASVFSIYTYLQVGQQVTVLEQDVYAASGEMTALMPLPVLESGQHPAQGQQSVAGTGSGIETLAVIWCVGAIICGVFFAVSYFRSLYRFRKAMPMEDGQVRQWLDGHRRGQSISVRQSERISAPLTYGCFRPVILLPGKALEESRQELEYILQHEYVHICYYDALLKLVMVAALCVHWFNPLVWIMAGLLNQDIELACDEGVLIRFGEQSRAGYAMALIRMEEKKSALMPLYSGFSKNAIEERINLIMKYRKPKLTAMAAAVVLIVAVALGFATSAQSAQATEDSPRESAGNGETRRDGQGALDGVDGSAIVGTGTDAGSMGVNGAGGGKADVIADDTTGSSIQESRPSSESPADIPEEQARQSEANFILNYTQEGILQEEAANLYTGKGYYLLVPTQGWILDGPDTWMWQENEAVRFWVTDWSGNTWEQAVARLEEDGYIQTNVNGILQKESDGRLFVAELRRSGERVMGIHYTYPAETEYIEGFGLFLPAVTRHFGLLDEGYGEELSEDGKLEQLLAQAFWNAYLTGNREEMEQYLAMGYAEAIDVFPDGIDGHVAQEVQLRRVKGMDTEERQPGDERVVWLEFIPAAGADYLEYLELELVKEEDGWKVRSYGLEL